MSDIDEGDRPGEASKRMGPCLHRSAHKVESTVTYLEDAGRFAVEFRLTCECGVPFAFVGLPVGLDLKGGATTGVDRGELRVVALPANEDPPTFVSARGFTIKGH